MITPSVRARDSGYSSHCTLAFCSVPPLHQLPSCNDVAQRIECSPRISYLDHELGKEYELHLAAPQNLFPLYQTHRFVKRTLRALLDLSPADLSPSALFWSSNAELHLTRAALPSWSAPQDEGPPCPAVGEALCRLSSACRRSVGVRTRARGETSWHDLVARNGPIADLRSNSYGARRNGF